MHLRRILLSMLLLLTACGGTQEPPASSAAGETDRSTATDDSHDAGMDDHAGTEQTGFAFGQPADATDADRTIEIRTDNKLAFDPAQVAVAAGETVTFAIHNTGDLPHDFVIGDGAAQEEHAREMSEMAAEGRASEQHVDANAVSVPAGETVELTWTFDGDTDGLRYGCHVLGHYEAGMAGEITVEG